MSEHITHVGVFEDSARLAVHGGLVCQPFRAALDKYWDLARFASATRAGDRWSIPLLKHLRERWPSRKEGDFTEEKLAFLLGWLTHQAADRRFKPVFRELQPEHYAKRPPGEESQGPADSSVMHDTIVFREVYGSGEWAPYSPGMLDNSLASYAAARALDPGFTATVFGTVFQRSLLALHPAQHTPEALPKRYQRFYVDLQRYERRFYWPSADELKRYIADPNFYNPQDKLLVLARALQRKQTLPGFSFEEARREALTGSQYAQSLCLGVKYLRAASEFFEEKITEKECRLLLDLNRTHLQGGALV